MNFFRTFFRRDPIDEELAHHYEALKQERLDAGDTPEQAARFARQRLGHAPAIREEVRDLSPFHRLENVARHVRFALRSYRKHGGAYVLATAILAAGIGLSVAIFSVVDAVILAPLPYPDQDRIHLIWKTDPLNQDHLVGELAYPELGDLQNTIPEIEHVALFPAAPYGNGRILQTGLQDPIQIESCPSSPDFFKVLGVQPVLGRGFEPGDSGANAQPVAVLSDRVWRQHFGARPNVVGELVSLNGRGHTVIGVMGPDFDFPRGIGLWVPLPAATRRGMIWLQAVARVRPGVNREALLTAADRTFQLQVKDFPKEYVASQRAVVTSIAEFLTGSTKPQLVLSLAASLLLLISACVSAGNLFLSRALARRQEISTRASLGATRGQILGQFAVESLLAAVIAASAGGLLAAALIRLLIAFAPAGIPRMADAGLNLSALGFAVAASLSAALACGLGPALLLRSRSEGLETAMRDGGTRTAGSRTGSKLQNAFLVLQTALTVTILIAGALLFASYRAMLNTDLGLGNRETLTMNLGLRGPHITPDSYRAFYRNLLDRLRAMPEVTSAAGILLRPLEGPIGWDTEYTLDFENSTRDPERVTKANFEVITPRYFETIGTPLLAGRDINDHDTADSEKVVVISRSLAQRFRNAGLDPLGQGMRAFGAQRKVIGVVADARYRRVVQAGEDVYVPNTQANVPTNYLVIRGRVPAAQLLTIARKIVKELDPAQAIAGEATLGEMIDRNIAFDRFNLAILLLFAAGAVLLAAAGIHSVVRESLAVRAKETAIRLALGAERGRLAADNTRTALSCVAAGLVSGIAISLALSHTARGLLYEVSPNDPLILASAGAFVFAIAAVSSFIPAWTAAGRDPREQLLSD